MCFRCLANHSRPNFSLWNQLNPIELPIWFWWRQLYFPHPLRGYPWPSVVRKPRFPARDDAEEVGDDPMVLRFQGNFPTFQAEEEEEEDDAVQEPETASETGPQRPQGLDFVGRNFSRSGLRPVWDIVSCVVLISWTCVSYCVIYFHSFWYLYVDYLAHKYQRV